MIHRGRVTRVLPGPPAQVFVEIAKLGLGVEFGPCDLACPEPVGGLSAGIPCVVGLVGGFPDDVVVLGFVG
jgi:hypothetical protein